MFLSGRFVLWFCYFTICLLCACGSSDSNKDQAALDDYIPEKNHEKSFLEIVDTANFSSLSILDTFRLSMAGSSIASSKVTFEIISPKLGQIYSDEFPTKALIGHRLIQIERPTEEEIEEAVKEGVNSFFQEGHFSRPAISPNESYQKEYEEVISEEEWEAIKKDSASVGFYYLLWEGDMKWISFCQADSSVKIYKVCC